MSHPLSPTNIFCKVFGHQYKAPEQLAHLYPNPPDGGLIQTCWLCGITQLGVNNNER